MPATMNRVPSHCCGGVCCAMPSLAASSEQPVAPANSTNSRLVEQRSAPQRSLWSLVWDGIILNRRH